MRAVLILFTCLSMLCVGNSNAQQATFTSCSTDSEPEVLKSVFGKITMGNLQVINSPDLDYNAVLANDGVIFTSTRSYDKPTNSKLATKSKLNKWKKKLSTLFYAPLNDGYLQSPQPLSGDVNDKYHESCASLTSSGRLMFFTRNNTNKNKKGIVHLKIYMAEKIDGQWTHIQELPFNSDDFSTCHPSISPDGSRLYFASNRKGGFGGMDIYVAIYQNNTWREPINLGPVINSPGNEIFPYVAHDDILYFSSSDQGGLGKLDVFRSKKVVGSSERTWQKKQNLGAPFNSPEDDFGFYINKDNTGGLFTSSRTGGKGRDDIYYWQLEDKMIFQASVLPSDHCVEEMACLDN